MSDATVPMRQELCCTCNMVFWMPKSFYTQCREQPLKKKFYCPAGHEQWYTAESELDKERRARQRAEQQQARLADEAAAETRKRIEAERALTRHKPGTNGAPQPASAHAVIGRSCRWPAT